MKNLKEYIIEKIIINKDIVIDDDKRITDINELKKIIPRNVSDICLKLTPGELDKHYNKMLEYKKKGSKPERLVNSIKDKKKLMIRWRMCIELKWKQAFVIFRDAIIDRGYFNINELNAFLIRAYDENEYLDWITL